MLKAEHLSVSVRQREILHRVSIQLSPGTFTAVVGPNGAGKSTLLRVLSHELPAQSGSVRINGNPLESYQPRALSQVRAVLPQQTQVQFAFTVEQIVLLGRHAHNATRHENAAIAEEVMLLTGTDRLRRRIYHTLSGGERQRVQLARVLAQVWEQTVFPRYLLLDEPTASLDIAQQDVIFSVARAACARNIGVMAIIHDLNLAVQYADNMLFMRDGRTVASGPAANVFIRENIEETFGCQVALYHLADREHPFMVPEQGNDRIKGLRKVSNQSSNQ